MRFCQFNDPLQTHTHTHTYRDIHTVTAIKYTTGQRNQFSYLHKAFLLTFNANSLFLMYFTWFCFFSVRANCFYFLLNDLLRAAPARRSQSTTFSKHVEFVSDTCIKCRCRCRRRCCHDYFQSDSNSRLTYTHTHTKVCGCGRSSLSLFSSCGRFRFYYVALSGAYKCNATFQLFKLNTFLLHTVYIVYFLKYSGLLRKYLHMQCASNCFSLSFSFC